MSLHLGYVAANSTLRIPFATYGGDGSSITISGLEVTDIQIYKDGSTTERASDNGYTLLDSDGIDFDGITGIHGIALDLSDNTTAGFYAEGSFYWVVVSAITIDGKTISFIACTFWIGPVEADVKKINGNATAAINLAISAGLMVPGTAITGTLLSTSMTTDLTSSDDSAYLNRYVYFRTGALAGQFQKITAYNGTTKVVTFAAFTTAMSNGDLFIIV